MYVCVSTVSQSDYKPLSAQAPDMIRLECWSLASSDQAHGDGFHHVHRTLLLLCTLKLVIRIKMANEALDADTSDDITPNVVCMYFTSALSSLFLSETSHGGNYSCLAPFSKTLLYKAGSH